MKVQRNVNFCCWAPNRLLLRACVGLLLFGTLTYTPVEGQRSPCPNIFSYWQDSGTNQPFGYIKLTGLNGNQQTKLEVDLSIAATVSRSNLGKITLIKSTIDTFRDINNNKPAHYRVNFPYKNIIPNVLSIRVNGRTICSGRKKSSSDSSIYLSHTIFPPR